MCSFPLGHWIIPFLSILVVQIGTMKRFYCPQKDASVVLWVSLSPDDQIFLWDKDPDAGQGAVCDLCVRSARPSAFFSRHSSSTSSTAPPPMPFCNNLMLSYTHRRMHIHTVGKSSDRPSGQSLLHCAKLPRMHALAHTHCL